MRLRPLYCVLLIVLLSGCGGGGGNDSKPPKATEPNYPVIPTPIPPSVRLEYQGNLEPVVISESNLLELASLLAFARDIITLPESLWVDFPTYNDFLGAEGQQTIRGESGQVVLTVNRAGGALIVTTEYENFGEQGVTFDGMVVQTIRNGHVAGFSPMFGSTKLYNFKVQITGAPSLVLDGTIEPTTLSDEFLINLTLSDQTEFLMLDQFVLGFSSDSSSDGIKTSINGDIYDSRLGKLSVITREPMQNWEVLSGAETWVSDGGILELLGKDSIGRLQALNFQYASLGIDKDADDIIESALRVNWSEVESGKLSVDESVSGGKILANPGYLKAAFANQLNTIHGLFSHSSDRQYLNHTWSLLAAPPDSTFTMNELRATTLTFTPDVIGDYIFQLAVSDGEATQVASVKVTVLDSTYSFLRDSVKGALEVEFDEGRFVIDGSSANSSPDFGLYWSIRDILRQDVAQENSYGEMFAVLPSLDFDTTFEVEAEGGAESRITFNTSAAGFDHYLIVDGADTRAVRPIDINNDDLLDLVTLISDRAKLIAISLGLGEGWYEETGRILISESWEGDIEGYLVDDLNGDMLSDIVVQRGRDIFVLFQVENGYFGKEKLSISSHDCGHYTTLYFNSIGIGDYDGDGDKDLVGLRQCNLYVWLNDGTGTFDSFSTFDHGFNNPEALFAHLDDDGRLDMVIVSDGVARVMLNNGEGFTTTQTISPALGQAVQMLVGDWNGDGFADAIKLDGSEIEVMKNRGDGTFEHAARITSPRNASSITGDFTDMDGDGDIDVAYTIAYTTAYDTNHYLQYLLLNDAALPKKFKLVELGALRDQEAPVSTGAGDYNGDGKMDYIVPNGQNGIKVYLGGIRSFSTEQSK